MGQDVVTPRGQILFKKDTVLSTEDIGHLRFYNFDQVVVDGSVADSAADGELLASEIEALEEENTKAPTPLKVAGDKKMHKGLGDDVSGEVAQSEAMERKQALLRSSDFHSFQMNYAFGVNDIKELFQRIIDGESVTQDDMQKVVDRVCEGVTSSHKLFDMLHEVKADEDAVYTHCINVSLLSKYIGRWLHFSESDQTCLGICGLMHDIGKLLVPPEVLNKKGKLTDDEFQLIRRHPIFGFNQLKNLDIDPRIKKAALMHHERENGSGYPYHRVPGEVHPFAQVVAIADVYDAMTQSRSYRTSICPFTIIENFENDGISTYNSQFLMIFLENIAQTYQGDRVILNDGTPADIAFLNRSRFSRPVLKLSDGTFLDLIQRPDLKIQSVI